MTCIVKKHHLKILFKEMQFVAFFIFHMENTRMQVKNDLRCLRQIIRMMESKMNIDQPGLKECCVLAPTLLCMVHSAKLSTALTANK